jgi:tripartite-type tricarboxylate transporter receptor subunit TctC
MKLAILHRRGFLSAMALAAGACGLPGTGRAQQDYPTRTIQLVCPFSPGGSADTVARIVAEQLSQRMGQTVVVYNRPGAGGNIGAGYVKSAKPDGYTLLLAYDGTIVINPNIYANLPFDPLKDFIPVGKIGDVPLLVIANPDVPAKTLAELVVLSKTLPNGLDYGTPGIGSTQQLMFELIKLHTGANFTNVPYGGAAPAIVDVLGGRIPLVGAALTDSVAYIKAGKLRALAISSSSRSHYLPDVPTLAESGIRDVAVSTWHGLMAPANTPRPIVQKLNTQLNLALNDPAVREHLDAIGSIAAPGTPDEFGEEIKSELVANAKLIKAANIPQVQ